MVFKNLAVKLFPGETIFKIKVHKNPSVLTDAVKETLVGFYYSDIISVISMKDKDEHGYKVRDEMGYSETAKAFEMFCEQHPKTKISQSTYVKS